MVKTLFTLFVNGTALAFGVTLPLGHMHLKVNLIVRYAIHARHTETEITVLFDPV